MIAVIGPPKVFQDYFICSNSLWARKNRGTVLEVGGRPGIDPRRASFGVIEVSRSASSARRIVRNLG
jgi:hypothetical protein